MPYAALVRDGHLVRLGYGVYGRAMPSRLSGRPMLYSPDGFIGAARQALDKLGVNVGADRGRTAYKRRPLDTNPGQPRRSRKRPLPSPSPLRKFGARA